MNALSSLGFSELITQPTRFCHYAASSMVSCSTLDHIITNSTSSFLKSGILVADISDHLPIFAILKLSKTKITDITKTFRRPLPEFKKPQFLNHLSNQLFTLDPNLNANALVDRMLLLIEDTTQCIFPTKQNSRKFAKLIMNPWMTPELLKEIKTRDKLEKKWQKMEKFQTQMTT